jgi:hypothetical protein
MPPYDDTFVDRFLEPWNQHDVNCRFAPTPGSGCFSDRCEPRPETTPRLAYRYWR